MSRRPTIDGIPLPDPGAIERQRRREHPEHDRPGIQPTIHDIQEEGYRRWQEEQQRRKPENPAYEIVIGGDDED